uniref:Uncharacterized protein n=1 Tax=Angiostrongylus cantonensis TaxID=6313 RepID=A0A0K0D9C3_ANGCA
MTRSSVRSPTPFSMCIVRRRSRSGVLTMALLHVLLMH